MAVKVKQNAKEVKKESENKAANDGANGAKKAGPPKKAKKTEDYFTEKYPHAIAGTLRFDESANKQKMKIKCEECGDTNREVYTSDLFQVKVCLECAKKKRAASRKKKEEETAEATA